MILPLLFSVGSGGGDPPSFADVAEAVGIRFSHRAGVGRDLILDMTGAGCALVDVDGDGDLDAYLLNGSQLEPSAEKVDLPNGLFRNEGGLRFRDATGESGLGAPGWSMGCVLADADGDGDPDLYLSRYGPDLYFRNRGGGTFEEASARARLGDPGFSTGCVFFDYDRDGDLDLFVAHYVNFDERLRQVGGNLDAEEFAGYRQLPQNFRGVGSSLHRSEGDGTFTDVTAEAGVAWPEGKALGAAVADFDGDGLDDLYVACDTTPNALFRNLGDGTFEDLSWWSGAAVDAAGRPQGSMGLAWGDVDGDLDFDLVVSNFAGEPDTLYRNLGRGSFEDATAAAGLSTTTDYVGWGTDLFDADLDGDLDLFVANGHVVGNLKRLAAKTIPEGWLPGAFTRASFGGSFRQPCLLHLNDGAGRFVDVSARAGPAFREAFVGRGAAFGDVDRDGDLDILVLDSNGPARLLRNDLPPGPAWLEVGLRGRRSPRDGVGAVLVVRAGERRFLRQVQAGLSYLSANPLEAHFGLGACEGPVRLEVRWPSGLVQVLEGIETRRRIEVVEGG
ncbi:MAG TPA: CRTAC1 family protein [Planctomycetota bacterium]|nr:CRTAC1 family protein [Planctomycetota bacterium]